MTNDPGKSSQTGRQSQLINSEAKDESRELEHDRRREATSAIRGYVYQAYQSILAWMRLNESEVLFLESAEDFDIHEGNLVETTQVKDTANSGSLTLRSSDVIKAINNFGYTEKQTLTGPFVFVS